MYYVLSYDVSDDRRRARIAKLMKGHGMRVQKSVFECSLEPDRLKRLIERAAKLLDKHTDSLRLYALCESCKDKIGFCGCGEPPDDGGPIVA